VPGPLTAARVRSANGGAHAAEPDPLPVDGGSPLR